jgi:hypothetical protein
VIDFGNVISKKIFFAAAQVVHEKSLPHRTVLGGPERGRRPKLRWDC